MANDSENFVAEKKVSEKKASKKTAKTSKAADSEDNAKKSKSEAAGHGKEKVARKKKSKKEAPKTLDTNTLLKKQQERNQ